MINCAIVLEEQCEGQTQDVQLHERVYESLCRIFGTYGFSWYFVSNLKIKYFKEGGWHYHDYKPSFIKGWGIFDEPLTELEH